ncbi:uncharacterized protein J3D65DRAFT_169630 [Phyllosticta citribraziliensis]|uniref:Cell surface protein n=1 Tax=Phyllosticta citribraziliensis TaxID=989973 RepID=A0ABR1L2Q8_9PEZI
MHYSTVVVAALAASVSAHGLVTKITGANGVEMPGLGVMDGTPRDCASPACGSEGDTSIIRDREISGGTKASALGRTNKGGKVDASKDIEMFMNGPGGAAAKPANKKRGLLDGILGGGGNGGGADAQGAKTPKGTSETGVKAAAGKGAASGMPTCSDTGEITLTYHQVNQDGAGPLKAEVDPTSGGTDNAAFKEAKVTQDVPGIGIGGLSGAAVMDFPVKVQMPEGMQCQGKAGGAENVCIVRVRNSAAAGPFGGSAAFIQPAAAKKRAIEYNLRKRHMARGTLAKEQ